MKNLTYITRTTYNVRGNNRRTVKFYTDEYCSEVFLFVGENHVNECFSTNMVPTLKHEGIKEEKAQELEAKIDAKLEEMRNEREEKIQAEWNELETKLAQEKEEETMTEQFEKVTSVKVNGETVVVKNNARTFIFVKNGEIVNDCDVVELFRTLKEVIGNGKKAREVEGRIIDKLQLQPIMREKEVAQATPETQEVKEEKLTVADIVAHCQLVEQVREMTEIIAYTKEDIEATLNEMNFLKKNPPKTYAELERLTKIYHSNLKFSELQLEEVTEDLNDLLSIENVILLKRWATRIIKNLDSLEKSTKWLNKMNTYFHKNNRVMVVLVNAHSGVYNI